MRRSFAVLIGALLLLFAPPATWARDRGARRTFAGRSGELYYTDDHYRTFTAS